MGKAVILRKYQLIETETLGRTVLISTRFCQEEIRISRFQCLAKPERSHRSSQEPGSQLIHLGLGAWGKEPYGEVILLNQIEQRLENERLVLQRINSN